MDNEKFIKEKELLIIQEDILAKEEVFWRQKSMEKWLVEGDRNTKFFHNSTIHSKALKTITQIKDNNGSTIDNPTEIAQTFITYYENLLNNYDSSNLTKQKIMLNNIPKVITEFDNMELNKPFTKEEIKLALFKLSPDKSPGLDGFQVFFFQKYWEILGEELWKVIVVARNGRSILAEINHTFLVLIPKKSITVSPLDFCPIALCNTIYKIYSKAIENKIKIFLPKMYLRRTNWVCTW